VANDRILVTNDDGIHSQGLHTLARALVDDGHDVLVVAPTSDRSGSGAAIGKLRTDDSIDVEAHELPGLPGVTAYAVDGPPALCVLAARIGAFGDAPTLVVSGINPGCNTGRSILHSGTVGAALTAANFGARGLAVSIDATIGFVHEGMDVAESNVEEAVTEAQPEHWETAARVAAASTEWLLAAEPKTVVNLNVPDVAIEALLGVRWAELAPFGTVRSAVVDSGDGRLQMELRATGVQLPPESDSALVKAGYAAVTTIMGVTATAPTAVADHIEGRVLRRIA
jgi:5'-nucleotidase